MEVATKASRNGFDLLALSPIAIEVQPRQRGMLGLRLSAKTTFPLLSATARKRFPVDVFIEFLGSDKQPDVLAIRQTARGTKYAVPLAKSGNLPKQIQTLLRGRGWEDAMHPAEWRDGALVIWRAGTQPAGVG